MQAKTQAVIHLACSSEICDTAGALAGERRREGEAWRRTGKKKLTGAKSAPVFPYGMPQVVEHRHQRDQDQRRRQRQREGETDVTKAECAHHAAGEE